MSESLLVLSSDASEDFNPNEFFPAEALSFQSGGDHVTVSMPLVGIPIAIGGIAAFVGKNLASSIVGTAGGKIFAMAMEAIGLGGDGVAAALKDISDRLGKVEKTVAEIKALCEEILERLEALQTSMEQSMLEGRLGPAFSNIRAAYGGPGTLRAEHALAGPISTPTLMELLNSLPKTTTKAELKEYAEAFRRGADADWKLTTQIVTISDVLTKTLGQSKSLLNRWAQGLITSMAKNELTLDFAYQTLEGYFLQAVGQQLTAVAMHCFVLGQDANPDTRLKYYLEEEFGPKMIAQTDEFLYAVERLVLSRVHLAKVPSTFTMPQSGEFPSEMESIFLRADLLCAALNLVGNKSSAASPRLAIIGIYGRCLARPSDIVNGTGPEIRIAGVAASRGIVGRAVEFIKAVDLRRDGDRLMLEDAAKSGPVIVRYFLPWREPLPAQGTPIDTRFRGGVSPAFYNVFSDNEWPLAAGFVDFSPLLQGAPADAPTTLDSNSLFRTDDPHTVIRQPAFVAQSSHPLVRPTTNVIEWEFDHAAKAHGTWHRTTAFHLFKYTGVEAPMRLQVNVFCETKNVTRMKPYHSDRREIDLNAKIVLIRRPSEGTQFYNSSEEQGRVLDLNNRPAGYGASVESWKTLDFTVKPGEYALHLDFLQWMGTMHPNYKGWETDRLLFKLKGVFIEWL